MKLELIQTKIANVTVLSLNGKLDSSNSEEIEKKIVGIVDDGEKKILLNMSSLIYISSAGLRVLLVLARKLKADNGKLVLCSMNPNINDVFDVAGFLPIFTIYPDQDEALKNF